MGRDMTKDDLIRAEMERTERLCDDFSKSLERLDLTPARFSELSGVCRSAMYRWIARRNAPQQMAVRYAWILETFPQVREALEERHPIGQKHQQQPEDYADVTRRKKRKPLARRDNESGRRRKKKAAAQPGAASAKALKKRA